jgi:periplasmic copper chaperone A
MVRKVIAVSMLAAGLVFAGAIPAWAHVTIAPATADKGASDVEIAFRVPNEESTNTTKIQIAFPTDTPLLGVLAQPVPGWTAKVITIKLKTPIQTDDGAVTDAVSEVDWTADSPANGIPPTEYQRFQVIIGSLPANASTLTFKALQTYAGGDVVRWIETGANAVHPAPVLTLTKPGTTATPTTQPTTTTTPTATASTVKKSDVDSARTIGIIGIVVGALGLLVGGAALTLRRRPS